MSDFTPVVKGGYRTDDALHRRNWHALSEYLRASFLGTAVLPKASAAPADPTEGQIYYDTGTSKAYVWDGSIWNALW